MHDILNRQIKYHIKETVSKEYKEDTYPVIKQNPLLYFCNMINEFNRTDLRNPKTLLRFTKESILDYTGYFGRATDRYNKQIQDKRLQVSQKELKKKILEPSIGNSSEIDDAYRFLFYGNKAAKELEVLSDDIVTSLASRTGISFSEQRKILNSMVLDLYTKKDDQGNTVEMEEFFESYTSYLFSEDDHGREALQQDHNYQLVANMIQKRDRKQTVQVEDIYEYLNLKNGISNLYQYKEKQIETIISYIKEEKEERDIVCHQSIDHEAKTLGKRHDTVISIAKSGYNAPVRVHASQAFVKELEDKYFPIPMGKLSVPYQKVVIYQNSPQQMKLIDEILASEETQNESVKSIASFQKAMLLPSSLSWKGMTPNQHSNRFKRGDEYDAR